MGAPFVEFPWQQQDPPPYDFRDVTSRGFTLLGSTRRLQAMCDRFLNLPAATRCGIRFCPLPLLDSPERSIVVLNVFRYGRIRSLAPGFERQGFSTQNEAYFSVPIVHHEDGIPISLDQFLPTCLVDNAYSVNTARSVLGLPKILARVDIPADPAQAYPISVETAVYPRFDPRTELVDRRVIEIGLDRGSTRLLHPGDPIWPHGPQHALYGPRGLYPIDPILFDLMRDLACNLEVDNYQLEQTRDARLIRSACYQALRSYVVSVSALRQAGPLPPAIVEIENFASWPMIDALGLDPSGRYRVPIPFWIDFDFSLHVPDPALGESGYGQSSCSAFGELVAGGVALTRRTLRGNLRHSLRAGGSLCRLAYGPRELLDDGRELVARGVRYFGGLSDLWLDFVGAAITDDPPRPRAPVRPARHPRDP